MKLDVRKTQMINQRRTQTRSARLAIVALLIAMTTSCDDGSSRDLVCEPGETRTCSCDAGQSSADICLDDGMGWTGCICEGDGGDGGDAGFECSDRVIEGDHVITDQTTLDAIAGVAQVTGMLSVGDASLTDLDGLQCLTRVGSLLIGVCFDGSDREDCGNPSLASLAGLDSLTTVDGNLEVIGNTSLQSVEALNALRFIGSLSVRNNESLESFTGLEQVSTLGGLGISGNASLVHLNGLEGLIEVGGLEVSDNDALIDLEGLNSLELTYGIDIQGNDSLQSLTGLESLRTPNELIQLFIHDNASLVELEGLHNLSQIGEIGYEVTISVVNNPRLTSLGGLRSLREVEFMYVHQNESLETLGLESLEFVMGLELTDNANLTNVDGLSSLISAGDIAIGRVDEGNPALTDLSGLGSLQSLQGLTIEDNDSLTTLIGLSSLESAAGLRIRHNYSLTQLELDALTTVSHAVTISENYRLPTCEAEALVSQLTEFGEVDIHGNDNAGTCE